jgi:hypothetical protein
MLEALPGEQARAREALLGYFEALHSGDYSRAAEFAGGGLEVLAEMNPSIAAADSAALLQAACTGNGFQCLAVRGIVSEREIVPGSYRFEVEFAAADGRFFVRGPCCGASETEMPSQSAFAYDVVKVGEAYLVQQLPVYVP